MVHIRRLAPADLAVLSNVAAGVFDDPVDEAAARAFLADPNHFLVVAVLGDKQALHPEEELSSSFETRPLGGRPQDEDNSVSKDEGRDGLVVGFVSAVRMHHPDKEKPELFINEIGVAPEYRRQGVGKALLKAMLVEAKKAGCRLVWLAVDEDNKAALALYRSAGGKAPEKQIHIDFDLGESV